jgi:hypothetical protein
VFTQPIHVALTPQGVGAPRPSGPGQESPDPPSRGNQEEGRHLTLGPDVPEGARPRGRLYLPQASSHDTPGPMSPTASPGFDGPNPSRPISPSLPALSLSLSLSLPPLRPRALRACARAAPSAPPSALPARRARVRESRAV